MGNVQISTQAVQALCEAEVPICYFSMGGWFYGITTGLNEKNVFLRRSQFRLAEQEYFARGAGAAAGGGEDSQSADDVAAEPCGAEAGDAGGIEGDGGPGGAARRRWRSCWGSRATRRALYFGDFAGMIKPDEERGARRSCRSISRGGTGGRRGIR